MSLIQDALKRKLEEEQFLPPKEKVPAPPVAAPPPPPPAPKNKPGPDSPRLLLILVAMVVLILIAIGAFLLLRTGSETGATETPRPAPVADAQPAPEAVKAVEGSAVIEPPPVIEKTPVTKSNVQWPELNLSGFASGGTKRLVIINGQMLSSGSRIKGVLIRQIGSNEVEVEYQGERRTLYTDGE